MKYTDLPDLLALAACINPSPPPLPAALRQINTPLDLKAWEAYLKPHPDREYVHFILNGIAHGFRIGFAYPDHTCNPASSNHPSANEHPAVISTALKSEVSKGRLYGPIHPTDFPFTQISSLGAIPKKHSVDKWRLILDLSHPKGSSVNDGISRQLCSLTYMKVDQVVQQVLSLGKGALLAKIDIESAFRNIPVHPDDRHLLGMRWNDELFIDTVFPFGLRSAPKIFNSIADALQWIAKNQGVTYLEHFLDDYVTTGAPQSNECENNLHLLVETCHTLKIPLAIGKKEGPSTTLTFLGIELDTIQFELRLPAEKLHCLQSQLQRWAYRKCCNKRDLESLVGYLHDASMVIRPGRTFIRRFIDLLKSAHHRSASSFLRLNVEARSDIWWWHCFISQWNGLSMMQSTRRNNPEVILTSDASGSWGCGAYENTAWFQYQWSEATKAYNITAKELLPIIFAAAIWGAQWENKSVLCRCDNEAVVQILNSGTSRDPIIMGLMRCLYFIAAKFSLLLSATHLAGADNILADALSRDNLDLFLTLHPQAHPSPHPIPAALLDLLIHSKPDWTSPSWSKTFNTLFNPPSPKTPCDPMNPAPDGIPHFAQALALTHSQHQNQPSASSLPPSVNKVSSTRPSNAICPAFDSPRSPNLTLTPSLVTCPDYTTSSGELNPKKRRKTFHQSHASQ